MGIVDKAKAAATAGSIMWNVASAPIENTGNTADTKAEGSALLRDRANNEAARMRSETSAKGTRNGGNSRNK
ncbi:hypothetical protein IM25_23840 (plasmid) [Rhodococcus sp. p52]|uniref:hypothetical protein n=1 Tax=Rhodococcus sp. p52 TaxID=935199 RepID=UPI000519FE50|nr:hypothetical protein [Rhodococcus sp. p52]AOD24700.1 hypothetical protein IM25_23390 [Rhodococcus sp. p52]AOD24771.1 hypothetical protein IM25_23840 [Rhodococcus sp. p52]